MKAKPVIDIMVIVKDINKIDKFQFELEEANYEYVGEWRIIENTIRESFRDNHLKLEGGESTKEVQDRALPIITSILKDKSLKTVAIGTHGNILTCILNYFDEDIGFEFWKASLKSDIYKCLFSETELLKIERIGFES